MIGDRLQGSEMASLIIFSVISLLLPSIVRSFYLPGVAPRHFQTGDLLHVKVNKLSSRRTQLPYDYYSVNFCKPPKIMNSAENLEEVLRGDRIENSVHSNSAKFPVTAESARSFKEKIDDQYRVNMILDNLPVAVLVHQNFINMDFELVLNTVLMLQSRKDEFFINNHLSFKVKYHLDPVSDSACIVGFEVTPISINHKSKVWDENNTQLATCHSKLQDSFAQQQMATSEELCSEDYHWWWKAYLTGGSSALYLFSYSVFYFFTRLEITKVVSGMLYFGYMLIGSYAFFVLTGSTGFYASFWFVRKIYSSVKID
ncbi:hypothetical protein JCGZ_07406 [Jatropha curcas]|uniref:Transmembrane 9 superfamily member n=1 Tax=Jatropha curcas TaxID=180498 RepID=A0A067KNH6_JATCU|nr:hypothetical protein JCGZ_07406 [Jatropha curcas]